MKASKYDQSITVERTRTGATICTLQCGLVHAKLVVEPKRQMPATASRPWNRIDHGGITLNMVGDSRGLRIGQLAAMVNAVRKFMKDGKRKQQKARAK